MTATIIRPTRVFVFGSLRLPDPDADNPDQVRELYAVSYPSLLAHTVNDPELQGESLVYTFKKPDVKTKGAGHAGTAQPAASVRGGGRAAGRRRRRAIAPASPRSSRTVATGRSAPSKNQPARGGRGAGAAAAPGPLGPSLRLGFDALTIAADAVTEPEAQLREYALHLATAEQVRPVAQITAIALAQGLIAADDAEACLRRAAPEGLAPLQQLLATALQARVARHLSAHGFEPVKEVARFQVLPYFGDFVVLTDCPERIELQGLHKASRPVAQWFVQQLRRVGFHFFAPEVLFAAGGYCEAESTLIRLALQDTPPTAAELDKAFADLVDLVGADEDDKGPCLYGIGHRDDFEALFKLSRAPLRTWDALRSRHKERKTAPRPASSVDERWLAAGKQLCSAEPLMKPLYQHRDHQDEYPLEYSTIFSYDAKDRAFVQRALDMVDNQTGEPIGAHYPIKDDVPLELACLAGSLAHAVGALVQSTSRACA